MKLQRYVAGAWQQNQNISESLLQSFKFSINTAEVVFKCVERLVNDYSLKCLKE